MIVTAPPLHLEGVFDGGNSSGSGQPVTERDPRGLDPDGVQRPGVPAINDHGPDRDVSGDAVNRDRVHLGGFGDNVQFGILRLDDWPNVRIDVDELFGKYVEYCRRRGVGFSGNAYPVVVRDIYG